MADSCRTFENDRVVATKKPLIIIQARMTSTRLPGKVLLPLCGKSVLEVMFDRLHTFKDSLLIATTNDGSETPIVALCEKLGIRSFRGETENVLERYLLAAKKYGATTGDVIVRLTSDCPLIDPGTLERMLAFFEAGDYDYLSNVVERTFPRGLDIEIFSFDALEKAYHNAATPFEKEHVTTYIHTTHRGEFSIGSFADKEDHSKYRLTLDEPADYDVIKAVYEKLGCRTDFGYKELIEVLEANPEIVALNAHVEQKKT